MPCHWVVTLGPPNRVLAERTRLKTSRSSSLDEIGVVPLTWLQLVWAHRNCRGARYATDSLIDWSNKMADEKYLGSCLCGEVRFEVNGPFEHFLLCHCQRCRKGTGSAHASNLFSTTATLNWLSGEGNISTYQVPDTRFIHSFCTTCGAAVPTVHGSRMKVPAGSLDSEITIKPNAHIFSGSRASWDDELENVAEFERYQTS